MQGKIRVYESKTSEQKNDLPPELLELQAEQNFRSRRAHDPAAIPQQQRPRFRDYDDSSFGKRRMIRFEEPH